MLEQLNTLDTQLFLFLNGKHNAFFDVVMYWASDMLFWFPFYAMLVFIIAKHYKKQSLAVFIAVAVLITLSDQTASHLIKNSVQRLRPSHEPTLQGMVHLSKAGAGGQYGFVSSHAANVFALTAFLFLLLPQKFNWLKCKLLCWAILVSYSRIYNGVHYPADVIVAALLGIFLAWLISLVYARITKMEIKNINLN